MKNLIIILALFISFSLRAETYAEFLKRLIPGNVITLSNSKGTRIKIGKIDGENIEDIKIFQYDKENKLKKEVFAKQAKIVDKGKGVATFILSKAILKHYDKSFTQVSHIETYEISFSYQLMAKINGKYYKIKRKE